jgi:hypothetical protein
VLNLTGEIENGTWTVSFISLRGWSYSLESSTDLRQWTAGADPVSGTGDALQISPPIQPGATRFFRVSAARQE